MANDPIPADKQACKNCRFSKGPSNWAGLLFCHRYPPTAQMIVNDRQFRKDHYAGITTWKETHTPKSFFPLTSTSNWCGEWQERV